MVFPKKCILFLSDLTKSDRFAYKIVEYWIVFSKKIQMLLFTFTDNKLQIQMAPTLLLKPDNKSNNKLQIQFFKLKIPVHKKNQMIISH